MARRFTAVGSLPVNNILDFVTGSATNAFSLRKLRSSYAGSAISLRRSSDNTEIDIGFDGLGNFNTAAALAFVGSGNGFITKWYDQSGLGIIAYQTILLSQPQIISSGVLLLQNSKPTMILNGTSQGLNLDPSIALNDKAKAYLFAVAQSNDISAGMRALFKISISTGVSFRFGIIAGLTANRYANPSRRLDAQAAATIATSTANHGTINNQITAYTNYDIGDVNIRMNGGNSNTATLPNTGNTSPTNPTFHSIGYAGTISGQYWDGTIQEIIFFENDQSASIALIEANQKEYYGTP